MNLETKRNESTQELKILNPCHAESEYALPLQTV